MRRDLFIVKVQRPVETSDPADMNTALVYNRDHTVDVMMPMDPAVVLAMAGEYKQFWYAYMEDAILRLHTQAPWQEW
jgi:hypothetical protein